MQTYRKSKHVEVPGEGRKCGSDLRDRAPGRMLAVWLINYVSIRGSNKLLKSADLPLRLDPGEGMSVFRSTRSHLHGGRSQMFMGLDV